VKKAALLKKVVRKLQDELALYAKAAKSARAEATDEQSRAENKYDTRGLEASYLARGQSRQAAELSTAIQDLESFQARPFAVGESIGPGALLTVDFGKETLRYFLLPKAGGVEVRADGTDVLVITPQSPVGSALMGRKAGESLQLEIGGTRQCLRIAEVE
jgi:hypothetical protein